MDHYEVVELKKEHRKLISEVRKLDRQVQRAREKKQERTANELSAGHARLVTQAKSIEERLLNAPW